jgi:hypothetical protein
LWVFLQFCTIEDWYQSKAFLISYNTKRVSFSIWDHKIFIRYHLGCNYEFCHQNTSSILQNVHLTVHPDKFWAPILFHSWKMAW